jgi:Na(+)-translocating NADH:ubiquinone oxidoreductase A subunit
MNMHGGYLPRIPGRPSSNVEELALPPRLEIGLRRGGLDYRPLVTAGQAVAMGDPLAEAFSQAWPVALPAPAGGRVSSVEGNRVILEEVHGGALPWARYTPERITRDQTVAALTAAGVWPLFWSSATGGMPSPDGGELPQAVVLNVVIAEPFRTRGKVILRRSWSRIVEGIKFLPRLMQDYGTIYVVLTAVRDPVARMMYADLSGFAWIRFRPVPLVYPVENPRLLVQALLRSDRSLKKDAPVWLVDAQALEAVGACLAEGLPLHQRVVVVGGPGHPAPRHLVVRVGTPLRTLTPGPAELPARVLRGGVFGGSPVDPDEDSVQYDDDAFFFLHEETEREPLSFMRLGFDRASYLPAFASRLFGGSDRRISTSLRGERRPCISCGLCESICPAQILPQVLHRYIHREMYEEAEKAGLGRCIECGLCSFVCPSKIELLQQFIDTKALLRAEREGE